MHCPSDLGYLVGKNLNGDSTDGLNEQQYTESLYKKITIQQRNFRRKIQLSKRVVLEGQSSAWNSSDLSLLLLWHRKFDWFKLELRLQFCLYANSLAYTSIIIYIPDYTNKHEVQFWLSNEASRKNEWMISWNFCREWIQFPTVSADFSFAVIEVTAFEKEFLDVNIYWNYKNQDSYISVERWLYSKHVLLTVQSLTLTGR